MNKPRAFIEGILAEENGLTLKDNPYSNYDNPINHKRWIRGFEYSKNMELL